MTYIDTEKSIHDNEPIELYKFSRAATGEDFFYTSAEDSISYLSNTYIPIYIQRGNIEQTEDLDKADVELDISYTADICITYISEVIIDPVNVTIYRGNAGGFSQYWSGVMDSMTINEPSATISCVPISKALENKMLHLTHSIQCPYTLFDNVTCKASRGSFLVAGEVESSDGTNIISASFGTKPDGWFIGGEIVASNRRRMIYSHVGSKITISPRLDVSIGTSFDATAGCGHNTTDCNTKFSNLDNFGGEPYIPTRDPWHKRIM